MGVLHFDWRKIHNLCILDTGGRKRSFCAVWARVFVGFLAPFSAAVVENSPLGGVSGRLLWGSPDLVMLTSKHCIFQLKSVLFARLVTFCMCLFFTPFLCALHILVHCAQIVESYPQDISYGMCIES